jgi:hypothetical protein
MTWTLANDGDRVEQDLGADVCQLFPNYEQFWALHVVPLTYRVMNHNCLFVRAKVRPYFEDMATANYGVFVHLAACHRLLNANPDRHLFAVEGVYTFYSRLYSVHEVTVGDFLPAANKIVERYSKRYIPSDCDSKGHPKRGTWRHETRLERMGEVACIRICILRSSEQTHIDIKECMDGEFQHGTDKSRALITLAHGLTKASANLRGQTKDALQ